jgi:pyruvate dehydrogenase (quinone)
MANVADFFIDTLKRAGVTRIWGLPGDSLNAFTDALRRDGGDDAIRWMHMRHEEAAAFAAGAEAELTASSPSSQARAARQPALHQRSVRRQPQPRAAAGDRLAHPVGRDRQHLLPGDAPQELFRECSVYTELVSDPAQLPWVLEIAMRTAVEKRGVAVVVVPGDVFFADAPDRRPTARSGRPARRCCPRRPLWPPPRRAQRREEGDDPRRVGRRGRA